MIKINSRFEELKFHLTIMPTITLHNNIYHIITYIKYTAMTSQIFQSYFTCTENFLRSEEQTLFILIVAMFYVSARGMHNIRSVKTQCKYRLTRGVDDRQRRPYNRSDDQMSRSYAATGKTASQTKKT